MVIAVCGSFTVPSNRHAQAAWVTILMSIHPIQAKAEHFTLSPACGCGGQHRFALSERPLRQRGAPRAIAASIAELGYSRSSTARNLSLGAGDL
jgi:hypothetical protein